MYLPVTDTNNTSLQNMRWAITACCPLPLYSHANINELLKPVIETVHIDGITRLVFHSLESQDQFQLQAAAYIPFDENEATADSCYASIFYWAKQLGNNAEADMRWAWEYVSLLGVGVNKIHTVTDRLVTENAY